MIQREFFVTPSGNWSGIRGAWPLVASDEVPAEEVVSAPMGLTADFLVDLFRFHMAWLTRVSGLNEAEAKRRVLSLLKAGRIGYQDETGKNRTLPGDAIVWVYQHV
ncbi:MAG: hypothetical protein HQM02_10640 [Magnetococcales bacterium]|nr:hypothetical protein [Magnetococcales bacterium]